jgi:nitroimidazol reductase NimA-like FMN-containing flavoprotein (pyridoxamine 5'-phosphate oxidase superfamily)
MFIHEMSIGECNEVLWRAKFGRLACARDNQPYVVPLNFSFDGADYLYGFTTFGEKVEWMRANPLVCFEVDEVTNHNQWLSVIVFGRYEELPDKPEFESAREHAYQFLQKRVMWWEPAYISQKHRDSPHSLTPIFFRIKIEQVTGHHANSDDTEIATATAMATVTSLPARRPEAQGHKSEWKRILKAALVYFLVVFGAGTLLGPIRILFVAPHLGERNAELLEAPVMLLVIVAASKWIVRKFQLPMRPVYRLGVGMIGFILGLLFEFGLVLKLRELTLTEYFASRDPAAAGVYYVTLVLFALMPLLVRRKHTVNDERSRVSGSQDVPG